METDGTSRPSSLPLSTPKTDKQDNEDSSEASWNHRNVSGTSDSDSLLSSSEGSDSDEPTPLPDRKVSARNGIKKLLLEKTSDYSTAAGVSGEGTPTADFESDLQLFNVDKSKSKPQGSSDSSPDSDSDSDGIVFAESDGNVSNKKKTPVHKRRSRAGASAYHKRKEVLPELPELPELPDPIGIRPNTANARAEVIINNDEGLSVIRYESQNNEKWVERSRTISANDRKLRAILKEDTKEAELLDQLQHSNIIQLKGFTAEHNGDLYKLTTVMEDGGDRLDDAMKSEHSIESLPRLMKYAEQLMNGLHYLEQQKVLHRDIKHANILIHPETDQLKIADFGMAHDCHTGLAAKSCGTDFYVAPEIRKGFPQSHACDIYSAGMVLVDSLISLNILSQATTRHLSPDGQVRLHYKDNVELDKEQEDLMELVQDMVDVIPDARPSAAYVRDVIRRYLDELNK